MHQESESPTGTCDLEASRLLKLRRAAKHHNLFCSILQMEIHQWVSSVGWLKQAILIINYSAADQVLFNRAACHQLMVVYVIYYKTGQH